MPVDHAGAARGAGRFQIPAVPAAGEICRSRLAWPQDPARLLRLPRRQAGPDALSRDRSRLVERIITKRDEGDIVVGNKPLVRRARPGGYARECGQFYVFVLKAGPDPPIVALVKVLPEANRELLCLLDVEGTGCT